jgi:hypothetical protein
MKKIFLSLLLLFIPYFTFANDISCVYDQDSTMPDCIFFDGNYYRQAYNIGGNITENIVFNYIWSDITTPSLNEQGGDYNTINFVDWLYWNYILDTNNNFYDPNNNLIYSFSNQVNLTFIWYNSTNTSVVQLWTSWGNNNNNNNNSTWSFVSIIQNTSSNSINSMESIIWGTVWTILWTIIWLIALFYIYKIILKLYKK